MTEDFQADAHPSLVDVDDFLMPNQLGVSVMFRRTPDLPAVVAVHLIGPRSSDPTETDVPLTIALDTERAIGLICQLEIFLVDAGVPHEALAAMLRQAHERLKHALAQDRAPKEDA